MYLNLISNFAAECSKSFLTFPTWFHYLKLDSPPNCTPIINSLSDVWLIVAAVIEILLRIASLVAVGFVIYGGISYITSQGSPDNTAKARSVIINALIGLVIAIMSGIVIGFIAGSIK